jgi:hypothetical protein
VHGMISAIEVSYYPLGAQVMTLVLPLGLFIVVMIALYFVFSRPHTVPGHRPITGARPISPHPDAAEGIAAASGMPLATGTGTPEPLADRGTAPVVGAQADRGAEADSAAPDAAGPDAGATDAGGTTGSNDAGSTGKPEDPE